MSNTNAPKTKLKLRHQVHFTVQLRDHSVPEQTQ